MNKKGFTLVEILVSIGLLALLGSVIAISLNRVFKDNNIKNYNEYVEKIKSSAMLYVNNTVDIINDLNDNSFKIITIGNLIDNGYLKDNIINPDTNKKIDKNGKIKVSYDSDHELIVTYPYNNSETEAYLYTLNYSVMYGDTTEDLCYVGLNTRSLQLIYPDGTPVKDNNSNKILVPEQNIKAYMENGEECTNLTSEKIGTYKIRYEYTKNYNEKLNQKNVEKKSAERTITVRPSKPVINLFTIKPQKAETDAGFSVYDAKMDLNVTDIKDIKLKYCIVGVKSDDTTSINNLMMKCSDEVKTVSGVNQLNNTWVDLTNGTISNNNKETYVISKNFNIEKEMVDYKDYSEIKFYVFVKNSFEEYSDKLNEYNNGIYLMTSMILFHLEDDAFFTGIKKETNNIYTIKNIANNTPFKDVMKNNTNYKRAYRQQFYFTGWSTTANGPVKYKDSTTTKVLGALNLYPVWIEDKEPPTCTLSISGSKIVASAKDNNKNNIAYKGWSSLHNGSNSAETAVVTGQTNYYVMDFSKNENTCSIDIQNTISYEEQYDEPYEEEYDECHETPAGTYGPTRSYDEARWYCPECRGQRFRCWANNTQCQCYCGSGDTVCETKTKTKYRTVTRTAYKCSDSSYKKYNNAYCYKN